MQTTENNASDYTPPELNTGGMLRGTASVTVLRIVEAVAGLIIVPLTLRYLGKDGYGLWALLYAVTSYLNLADFGFSAAFNRYFVLALQDPDPRERFTIFSTSLAYMSVLAVLILAAGLLLERPVVGFFPQTEQFGDTAFWVWRAMLLVLCLGYLGSYARSLFYCTHRISTLSILTGVITVLNVLVIVAVLTLGWGLIGLAAGAVAISLLRQTLLFLFGIPGVTGWRVGWRGISSATFSRLWTFGAKVLVARIAEMIYFQFDRLLLGRVLGLQSVTSYDVGAKAAGMANQAPLVFLPVIEPAAAELAAHNDFERFAELMRRSCKYVAIAAMGLGAFILLAGKPLLELWLGNTPEPSMLFALKILVVAYMTVSLTGPIRVSARAAGHPGWEATTSVVQAGSNVVLSILLYFRFGFTGVLIGTLCATIIGQSLLVITVFRGLQLNAGRFFRTAWAGSLTAALTAGGLTWLLLHKTGFSLFEINNTGRLETLPSLAATGIFFGVVFLAVIFITKTLTPQELKGLRDRLRSGKG